MNSLNTNAAETNATEIKAIEIKALTKRFGARTAVDGLSLEIKKGELMALLGVNGAGKTTTIKMLCCLLPPTEGDALVLGDSIVREPQKVKGRHNISPQETAVAPNLTIEENLMLMAGMYGASKAEAKARAKELMASFELLDRAKDMAGKLSGGLQRRLSIAMALISEPEVLFLDEPTLGLDVRARRDLWKIVEGLKGKITIVLTTHYLEEAEALSDRIAIMHEGRLRAVGTAAELKAQTGTENIEDMFIALTDAEMEGDI